MAEVYPDPIVRQATTAPVAPLNTTATEANPDNIFAPVATYTTDTFARIVTGKQLEIVI